MELYININVHIGFQFNCDAVIQNTDLFAAVSTVVGWRSS